MEKKYFRVLDSTYYPTERTKKMIGKEYECDMIYYYDNKIALDAYSFNFSDVVELTPIEFKGKKIAIGDEIRSYCSNWYKVCDYYDYGYEYRLVTKRKDGIICIFSESEISNVKFQGAEKREILKIGDKDYDKKEVEEALKNIKSLN